MKGAKTKKINDYFGGCKMLKKDFNEKKVSDQVTNTNKVKFKTTIMINVAHEVFAKEISARHTDWNYPAAYKQAENNSRRSAADMKGESSAGMELTIAGILAEIVSNIEISDRRQTA
jgi:hypothetical protein